ncbi:MAG: type II toxin-antitoxin system YhaV family toxin [Caulobacter sp.]|nr:type II toxin-antitoxin system YhaV family toxin [Caulobacter sp.]
MASVKGWELFAHPEFTAQLERLVAAVARAKAKDPKGYAKTANAKLLAQLEALVWDIIPADPAHPSYRQGVTLGPAHKHWFRAKFGGGRFRLFFRYRTDAKIIVYAWVNDQDTLRTYGARTDAYAVFKSMLDDGSPPDDWRQLVKQSTPLAADPPE